VIKKLIIFGLLILIAALAYRYATAPRLVKDYIVSRITGDQSYIQYTATGTPLDTSTIEKVTLYRNFFKFDRPMTEVGIEHLFRTILTAENYTDEMPVLDFSEQVFVFNYFDAEGNKIGETYLTLNGGTVSFPPLPIDTQKGQLNQKAGVGLVSIFYNQ
jgi:hypothetical protein